MPVVRGLFGVRSTHVLVGAEGDLDVVGDGTGTRLSHWIAHALQPRFTLPDGIICE